MNSAENCCKRERGLRYEWGSNETGNVPIRKGVEMGGSPCLVDMGRDSLSKGRGFESRHRILDGHFFINICCKIVLFVQKDQK